MQYIRTGYHNSKLIFKCFYEWEIYCAKKLFVLLMSFLGWFPLPLESPSSRNGACLQGGWIFRDYRVAICNSICVLSIVYIADFHPPRMFFYCSYTPMNNPQSVTWRGAQWRTSDPTWKIIYKNNYLVLVLNFKVSV